MKRSVFLTAGLRIAFRLLYNELAWTYDLVSWGVSAGQWRAWQRTALPYVRAGPVLDVAHGTGSFLLDLQAAGKTPVGLDLSPAMSRLARRKVRSRLPAVPLARGRVQALPFASSSFGSLVATFPTEFILDAAAVVEFYRVLASGGVLVIVPVAVVTGLALPDRLARALLVATDQATEAWLEPLQSIYQPAGFATHVERVRLPRSEVLVIIAEKSR
jgi:ubiquinone/menaquinone biosynthesis C-methylase UbiE